MPVQQSGGFTAFLRKAILGLIALLFLVGLLNRLISGDDPSPQPAVVANTDSRPTRTAIPRDNSPTRTDRPDPTAPQSSKTPPLEPKGFTSATQAPEEHTPPSEDVPVRPVSTASAAQPTFTFLIVPTPGPTGDSLRGANLPTETAAPAIATQTPVTATRSELPLAATDCSGYDAWEWAQSVYETDRVAFAGLDPDGDGTACPNLGHGFAPAFWTTALPSEVVPGTLSYVVDGDTFEIEVNGQSSRYRLYRANTPETQNATECGGSSATEFVQYVLSFSDTPGQVWVESIGQRDGYGRTFAYLWITVAGEPYLLNHVLINNGWAEDIDYGDAYDPYRDQLRSAANFASNHKLGVWNQCGGFGIALPTQTPFVQPTQAPAMNLGGGCVPSYSPCVPAGMGDLNCPEIGFRVQVNGPDPYGIDADNDGVGCESY